MEAPATSLWSGKVCSPKMLGATFIEPKKLVVGMRRDREAVKTIHLTEMDEIQYTFLTTTMETVAVRCVELREGKLHSVVGTYFENLQGAKRYFDEDQRISDCDRVALVNSVRSLFVNASPGMNPEVLFVDDEEQSRRYFERYYGRAISVITAAGYDEAVVLLQEHSASIRVIVSDQRMVNRSGTELLSFARDRYPHVTRLLCTAYTDMTVAVDAINCGGIQGYLEKPFRAESWTPILERSLQLGRRASEEDALLRTRFDGILADLPALRMNDLRTLCLALTGHRHDATLEMYRQAAEQASFSRLPTASWDRYDYADLQAVESERLGRMGYAVGKIIGDLTAWCSKREVIAPAELAALFPVVVAQIDGKAYLRTLTDASEVLFGPPGRVITETQAAWFAAVVACAMRAHVLTLSIGPDGARIWIERNDTNTLQ